MAKTQATQSTLDHIPIRFDPRFLENYVGKLAQEPKVAVVELVANCWDAGASQVNIQWPTESGGPFKISDNGTGMSRADFQTIWATIDYNRIHHQSDRVVFPPDILATARPAYGHNGKGRHSLFCFSDHYSVETWKDGIVSRFNVRKGTGGNPIDIDFIDTGDRAGHGTAISCNIERKHFPATQLMNLIGSKFITDPSFSLAVNERKILFSDFRGKISTVHLPDGKTIEIILVESQPGRTSLTQGIAWWVSGRLVKEPSWEGVEGILLDRRTKPSRVYTFIVKADALKNEVNEDWLDFKDTEVVRTAKAEVTDFILSQLGELTQDSRKEIKRRVIGERKEAIRILPDLSQERVGSFIDQLQSKYPRMGPSDLSYALDVFASMESARSGYDLLRRLATIPPEDIDQWNDVLTKWSATDAKIVLDELQRRLAIIEKIEELTENPTTKELTELQPLFEAALWIFGEEYDGIKYFSNRALVNVLQAQVEKKQGITGLNRRPDFVVLKDSTMGAYATERYENRRAVGIDKVLLVELKGGGSKIGINEIRQGQDYAMIVRNSGKVPPTSEIHCFVLGASIDLALSAPAPLGIGTSTEPRAYNDFVKTAQAKTFNLMNKIREAKGIKIGDKEVSEMLAQKSMDDSYVKDH